MITHAFHFINEDEAVLALSEFRVQTEEGSDWDRQKVDGPILIDKETGEFITDPETGEQIPVTERVEGYHLNVILESLDITLPELIGAWDTPGNLVYGDIPATPFRVFS